MNKMILGIASVSSVCILGFVVQQEQQYQRQQELNQVIHEAQNSLNLIEQQFIQQDGYVKLKIKNTEQIVDLENKTL